MLSSLTPRLAPPPPPPPPTPPPHHPRHSARVTLVALPAMIDHMFLLRHLLAVVRMVVRGSPRTSTVRVLLFKTNRLKKTSVKCVKRLVVLKKRITKIDDQSTTRNQRLFDSSELTSGFCRVIVRQPWYFLLILFFNFIVKYTAGAAPTRLFPFSC